MRNWTDLLYKNRKEYVKNIGVVFGQRSQLWWDVPVVDSYELLKDIYRIDQKEYEETLKLLTEKLHLEEVLNVPLRQLREASTYPVNVLSKWIKTFFTFIISIACLIIYH